ncbi:MAG: serine hydrolase [Chloroflexi bacterium]|uniref:serine hydrolase n=1 Tax=Candidatus Flexifilum breve TaxID=3140694 RepID=UPI0031359163|nr:serine hydrolase [Chloroflexota bacterium]
MDYAALEQFLFQQMSQFNTAGVSLALIADDQIIWARGFGLRSIEQSLPATTRTIYPVASVSKSFTAAAILQLAEAGKLSLDDPVEQHLPWFTIKPGGESIRITHLLSHTSGMAALGSSERIAGALSGARNDFLPLVTYADVPQFLKGAESWTVGRPGERYMYSNEGYMLLGCIIQQITGQPHETVIRDQIFQPLGMANAYYNRADVEAYDDVASLYQLTAEGKRLALRSPYRELNAHSGIVTNVLDLSRYVRMYLRGGELDGARVLQPESVAAMQTARVATSNGAENGSRFHYGYGLLNIPDFFDDTLIGHGGSIGISTSFIGWLTQRKVGVAVLMNGTGVPTEFIGIVALTMLAGADPYQLPFVVNEGYYAPLVGTYRTYMNTVEAQVRRQGDFLSVTFKYDDYRSVTTALAPDIITRDYCRFYTVAFGSRMNVEFHIREQGQVDLLYERYLLRKARS